MLKMSNQRNALHRIMPYNVKMLAVSGGRYDENHALCRLTQLECWSKMGLTFVWFRKQIRLKVN